MKLVSTSLTKPITVAVGVIFICLFGLLSLFRIPIQLTPDVEKPRVTVTTTWLGASPQEVETEIIQKQERELKSVEGLIEMTSECSEGQGQIILEFRIGTDLDTAALKVSNQLEQVKDYPLLADKPTVSTTDERGNAMAWFIIKPLKGNKNNINHLRDYAEDYLKPRFERVPGVGSSNVFGGQEREMQVIFDPQALSMRGVTVAELGSAIDRENKNFSAGSFDEGKRKYRVRTMGEYQTPEDIENIVINRRGGSPIYVRDVAEVKLGYKDLQNAVRQNGEPAIAMNCIRETGANSLEVMAGLKRAMKEMNEGLLKERNLYMQQVYDETVYITSAIDLVQQNLIIGGILAIAVLLLFLRSGSSTLIIATAIPISVIGSFIIMGAMGRTINVISLAGMSFAVGMVVDNSIVVLENIYRHMQMGKTRLKAAYEGTTEVWGAVLASTLTTTAVFLPIVFIEEQAGQLFRDIAIAISVSVLLSLIVAITVIPTACSLILSVAEKSDKKMSFTNLFGLIWIAEKFAESIAAFVKFIVSHTILRVALIVFFVGGAFLVSWALFPKTEYLPGGNRNLVFGILLPPPGYNVAEFTQIGRQIEKDMAPYWEAELGSPEAEKLDGPPITHFFYVARGRSVFMGSRTKDPKRVRELIPVMQRTLSKVPGMIAIVSQSSIFQRGLGERRSIDIQVTGPDLERLIGLGGRIFGMTRQILPEAQARPIPSLDLGDPEVQVTTDRQTASKVQITNQELGFTINALVDGVKVSEYQYQGDEIDLVIRGRDQFANRIQDIENLIIYTNSGERVDVGSIAKVTLTNGPAQINRFERQRTITIQVIPPETLPLETAIETIQTKIVDPLREEGAITGAYDISLRGTADELTVTRKALQGNFLLAALIAFLLMSSLFESFLYPLVIMFTVPLASMGGFLGLATLNFFGIYQPLDILTMLGFIILIGIVVNNAILIVHQALNHMREDGLEIDLAIEESVKSRIRPIFMTTVTSCSGMAPLILFPGAGAELYRGIGSVVLGGLICSTIFTIFLIPPVFSFAYGFKATLVGLIFGQSAPVEEEGVSAVKVEEETVTRESPPGPPQLADSEASVGEEEPPPTETEAPGKPQPPAEGEDPVDDRPPG